MRRTLTFISAFALMLSMLAIPAAADHPQLAVADHCPLGAGGQNYVALPEGYENYTAEKDGTGKDDNDFRPADDDVICIKSGRGSDGAAMSTGLFVVDNSDLDEGAANRTLQEWLFHFGIVDGTEEQGRDVSYWMLYTEPELPFEPEGFLAVTKTAAGEFTRTFKWDIEKTGETEMQQLFGPGDYVDLDYDVLVTQQNPAEIDDDYAVSGTIVVSNGGNAPAAIDEVYDSIDGAIIACFALDEELFEDEGTVEYTVPVASGHVLLIGEEIRCTYHADLDDASTTSNTAGVAGTFLYTDVGGDADVPFGDAEADPEQDLFEGTATFSFGTPTTLVDACVKVDDTLEGFLGYVCVDQDAADDLIADLEEGLEEEEALPSVLVLDIDGEAEFTYTYRVTFGSTVCAAGEVDNTATVRTLEGSFLNDDEWTVDIECFVFAGETAWAADGTEPGQLRYNQGRRGGNWATFIDATTTPKSGNIYAGQHIWVGTYSIDGDNVLDITLFADWELKPGEESVKIEGYDEAPSGNPAPGQFSLYKGTELTGIQLDGSNYYGIHLDVGAWVAY